MKRMKKILIVLLVFTMSLGLAGCSTESNEAKSEPVTLTISAAASLTEAMGEIQEAYAEKSPDTTLVFNFGSSGTLAQQITEGAQVDVFMSASKKDMTTVKDAGELDDSTWVDLLQNEVVLIVPSDSTLALDSFEGVTDPSVTSIGLGEMDSVPAGRYAKQVFTSLGILDQVTAKAVYGKDVKEVLAWVETGNVDAGVVYSTDAESSDSVKVVATADPSTHDPIVYPVAMIKTSQNVDASKEFIEFLQSDKAKGIFEGYGFTVSE
ncbi:MAG: molybdate transport system substrate-binding protein [Eubacteriaceae bacterium]|jgi:molybdate transport system substrate-binding protein|nr:molybdate transport system substrate-binding protein [Eubacteriaceae bacterium]MDK2937061.1 molybdate transport system substrate-binding protein [Eubacteriaceae bacterium]MDK2962497.1 molybdate transport system substrate-binding protein [Eubacteriaceae bacterium]